MLYLLLFYHHDKCDNDYHHPLLIYLLLLHRHNAGIVASPLYVHQEDDFVLDVRGMLSYGDAVKEKTFGFGSRNSSSSSISNGSGSSSSNNSSGGGGAGSLKITDCSLDRHIVFNHCSLSAIQVTFDLARPLQITWRNISAYC
jgi:hypothetical protein